MPRPPSDKDKKAQAEAAAYRYNCILSSQGLGVTARRDRQVLSDEAAKELAEQREIQELRRKASYVALEAQQPYQPGAQLLRRDGPDAAGNTEVSADPPPRQTYEEMQIARQEYPPVCHQVHEYRRQQREERRKRAMRRKSGPREKK